MSLLIALFDIESIKENNSQAKYNTLGRNNNIFKQHMCENKLGKVYSHLEIMNLIDAIPAQYNEKYASSFNYVPNF